MVLNIPIYESQRNLNDIFHVMTFSGKHGILGGILQNLFKTFENGFKLPIDEMEDLWKFNQAGMTQSGKHVIFDGITWNLLKMCTTNSKFLESTPNSPSVILDKF